MRNRNFKYFLVSAGLHALGFGLIFWGNMVVSQTSADDTHKIDKRVLDLPIIQQIPQTLVDEAIYNPGGAQEIGEQTEAKQPAQQVKAEPPPAKKEVKQEPKRQVKKSVDKPKAEPKKTTEKPKPTKKETPKTQPVKEKKESVLDFAAMERAAESDMDKKRAEADRRAKAEAKARAEAEEQAARDAAEMMAELGSFNSGLANSKGKVSSSTSAFGDSKSASNTKVTGASPGNGNGQGTGEAVANYLQAVRSIYDNAWVQPPETESVNKSVTVKIVINRDGSIRSADIVQKSGYDPLDKSVRNVLTAVRRVPAFPKSSKDQTRTYTFKFSLEGINL